MKKIGILGSTGSIGTQALELIDDINFKISYLSAYSNVDLLIAQTNKFKPESICIVDESKISLLKKKLNTSKIEILSNFRQRVSYDISVEFSEAVKQVKKIANLRLNEINKK